MPKNLKLYNKIHNSYKGIIFIIFILSIIVMVVTFNNYISFRDDLIEKEQAQLLTIAKSSSQSLEDFIDEKLKDSAILMQNIVDDSHDYFRKKEVANYIKYSLDSYMKIQRGDVFQIQFYDVHHDVIHISKNPEDTRSDMVTEGEVVFHDDSSQPKISEIYRIDENNLAFHIMTPVIVDENVIGYIRMILKTETLYELYIKDIRVGTKGYVSVKDSNGILLMHPKHEDIGNNVLLARKTEFPDYDWSALEGIIKKQKDGKPGTGIYYSIWYHDEKKARIKKFSAYSPVKVQDDFWIANVSMDYRELSDIASRYFYTNILILGFFPIVLVALLVFILNLKKNLIYLENEQMYLTKVNDLNVELERDIEERKELEKALLASKERFKQLFNAGSDLTFVLYVNNDKSKYVINRVNDIACIKLGLNRKNLVGKDFLTIDTKMGYSDMDKFIELILEDDSCVYETELTMVNGEKVPVEIAGQVFTLEDQSMMMLMARDISKKKEEEEVLEKNRALLIYKFRLVAMGEMIANIAHQWRQPLGSLSLMISNLEDAYNHDDLSDAYFNEVIQNTQGIIKKMSIIIDEFRYFFNPRNEKDYFDPVDQINSSLEMVKDRIQIGEVEINIANSYKGEVFGFPNQLSQVMLNIISNSLDAMKGNTGQRQLDISIDQLDLETIKIVIKNNGEPMPTDVVGKVFDSYFTTKESKDGTGIGLYMTKMIIETNFSGEIRMYNVDDGVTTEIMLPIQGEKSNE